MDTAVFDKTGTLTQGRFEVIGVESQNGFKEQEVLEWAALAEIYSNHPIARSVRELWARELDRALIEQYEEIQGSGIKAIIKGNRVLTGSSLLLEREGVEHIRKTQTGTVVYVAVNRLYAGCLMVSDQIKKGAADAMQQLKQLGVREIIMLSGDDRNTSESVAAELGVDQVYSELLPYDKVKQMEAIKELIPTPQGRLVFVGDGITHAPVLARGYRCGHGEHGI